VGGTTGGGRFVAVGGTTGGGRFVAVGGTTGGGRFVAVPLRRYHAAVRDTRMDRRSRRSPSVAGGPAHPMLRSLAKLLAALNSEAEPAQISVGLCLGMILGLTPLFSLHNLLVVLLALVLRVNLSGVLVGFAGFSAVAWVLDPMFDALGLALLTAPGLEALWTSLYASGLWRLARFNNSIVMGSVVCSLLSFVPAFLLGNLLIRRYRAHVLAWVRRTRLMTALKATRFWGLYQGVAGHVSLP